jgi:hypothetical protein
MNLAHVAPRSLAILVLPAVLAPGTAPVASARLVRCLATRERFLFASAHYLYGLSWCSEQSVISHSLISIRWPQVQSQHLALIANLSDLGFALAFSSGFFGAVAMISPDFTFLLYSCNLLILFMFISFRQSEVVRTYRCHPTRYAALPRFR